MPQVKNRYRISWNAHIRSLSIYFETLVESVNMKESFFVNADLSKSLLLKATLISLGSHQGWIMCLSSAKMWCYQERYLEEICSTFYSINPDKDHSNDHPSCILKFGLEVPWSCYHPSLLEATFSISMFFYLPSNYEAELVTIQEESPLGTSIMIIDSAWYIRTDLCLTPGCVFN